MRDLYVPIKTFEAPVPSYVTHVIMNRFGMTNGYFYVTDKIKETFDRDGFIVVKELFNKEEVDKLRKCIETSEDIPKHAIDLSDGKGAKSRLCIWNRAGNDACGVASRLQKVAGTLQALLGGHELYHYHTKLMMKEPEKGGAFLWHQDYGYWYQNQCLTPDMGSVFMPVDRCTKENSCLQVLAGSHKMGRIEHYLMGDQSGADPDRVQLAKQRYEHVYVEMEPGDALFFHSNLLHASDQNKSMLRRWVLVTSYNQKINAPEKKHHHLDYHPLEILHNQALIECTRMDSTIDKAFMDPKEDKSASSLKRKE